MPDPDDERQFAEIVAQLRSRTRARRVLIAGIVLCLVALLLITLGGVKGAVFAVIPWLLGLILVIRGSSRR
jgi:fatty acid desaturase